MVKILVDTCVWLDLAKDPDQQPLLSVIEELIKMNELSLIVPRTVIIEFERNKAKIVKESSKSLSSVFKRVKEAVDKFGDPKKKRKVLDQLNDVDHKIPLLGETVASSIKQIEKILKSGELIELTDSVKLSVVQRAIEKKAPFHRQKNSIDDAIIIETYASCLNDKSSIGNRFSFVTHNKNDFSHPNGNENLPHPDIASYFSKRKSLYFLKLAEAIHRVRPDLVTELMLEQEFSFEPRGFSEILQSEKELETKIWYNRHQNWLYRIEKGEHKIVERKDYKESDPNATLRDIFEGARRSAKKVERIYGLENLGPWDDFEWGMINGKLSALRWVMGEDWDELYT